MMPGGFRVSDPVIDFRQNLPYGCCIVSLSHALENADAVAEGIDGSPPTPDGGIGQTELPLDLSPIGEELGGCGGRQLLQSLPGLGDTSLIKRRVRNEIARQQRRGAG